MLREFINSNDWVIANNQNYCKGKWTRVNKKGTEIEKLIIDFVILNSIADKRMKKLLIDEEKEYILENLVNNSISDHNTMILEIRTSNVGNSIKKDRQGWNWKNKESLERLKIYIKEIKMN